MDWDNLYIRHPEFCIKEPAKEVVDLVPLIDSLPGKKTNKRVYDLGFGAGRHIIYLAKRGYKLYGGDISLSGKRITQKWMKRECIKAKLKISDMGWIPYKDCFFDVIINRGVITHNNLLGIKRCISEMHRTLKRKGLVMVTFISTESSEYGQGKKVEKDTFIPTNGPEKGVVHHFVSKKEVKELMKNFERISLTHCKHKGILNWGNYVSAHWIFVGRKK
jgi:SAM-dependent methyltransferase